MTDEELKVIEVRARLEDDARGEELLELVAEVRRLREPLRAGGDGEVTIRVDAIARGEHVSWRHVLFAHGLDASVALGATKGAIEGDALRIAEQVMFETANQQKD